MKLTTTTFVSVDGVMQGIGGSNEDRSGGFERGGWTTPLFDKETATLLNQVYERADAFLLGRRTYEIFAGSWGAMADPSINPIAVALNTMPKYVASSTLTEPQWADTTVLSGRRGRDRRAESEAGTRAAGAWQRRPDPVAARQRPCRRAQRVDLPGGRRPGHTAVPRHRPGQSATAGRLAGHPQRGDGPGVPAHWAPAVRNVHD
jgi:dihydrofolate reductase